MDKNINKIYKYSIRKFKVGVGSAIVGLGLVFAGQEAMASEEKTIVKQEVTPVQNQVAASHEVTPKVEVTVEEESVSSVTIPVENSKENVEPVKVETSTVNKIVEAEVSENTKNEIVKENVAVAPPVGDEIEVAASVVTANNQDVTDIVAATKGSFKDDELADRYTSLNVRERLLDTLAIRTAIAKERGTTIQNVPANDTEVIKRVQNFYLDKLTLTDAYNNTKADIETELTMVLNNTPMVNPDTVKQTILTNTGQILTGLAYLNRYYSFGLPNGKSAKDVILETPSALTTVLNLGSSSYSELEALNTYTTFQRKIGPRINYATLTDFIEAKVGTANVDDWYANTSKAIIVEQESKDSNINARLYTKMKSNANLRSHILPLLSLTDSSIYAISTITSVQFGLTDTYIPKDGGQYKAEDLAKLKTNVEKVAEEQGRYLDTWYRIVSDETKPKLDRAVISIDAMQRYSTDPKSTSSSRWASESGASSTSGIREFMSPLGRYAKFTQANGEAEGESMRFYMMRALTPEGNSTYSHEMTHILDKIVWFNGEGRRDGLNVEVFARGLFEVIDNSQNNNTYDPVFNLNFLYDLTGVPNRVQNETPERFKKEEDIKTFMSGMFDVLYTLDYAESVSALNKSNLDKVAWFNRIEPIAATDSNKDLHVNDNFVRITEADAEKLKNINDLVENDIVVGRFKYKGINTTGVAIGDQPNSYYVIPMFEPIYAAMQNSQGVTGDITVRRQTYELLAEYGYRDGLIPYISNSLKDDAAKDNTKFNDDYVFAKIMPEYKGDYATFKKAMFERRINKVDQLKPVTIQYGGKDIEITSFTQIQELMNSAVDKDLAIMKNNPDINRAQGVTHVQDLKEAIFRAYLKDTKDFSDSIYREPLADTNEPTTTPVKATWTNGYVAPTEELVKNAVTIDNKLVKSKVLVPEETTQSEVTVLVTYTDNSTDKVKVPVSIDSVTKREVVKKSIRFERDDNLDFGKSQTIPGSDGSFDNVYTYTAVNGTFTEAVSKQNEVPAVAEVVKVGTKPKVETVSLPKGTEYQADPTKDFEVVETKEGKDGQEVITTTYTMDAQGNVTANPSTRSRTEAVNTVVVKGTKEKVETKVLPKGIEYQADPTKEFGFENTVEGKDGSEVVTTTYTMDAQGNVTANPSTGTRTEAVNTVVVKGTKSKIETKVLPKGTEYQADPTKDFGFENTVEGKDGSEVVTTTYTMNAQGNVTANPSTTTRTAAVNTVVVKGTKSTTRVEETPYIVNRIDSKNLKVGTERVQTKGQNGIVNHVTTYVLNPQTGEVVPTVTRVLVQEKIDEVILVGVLEIAKGDPAFAEDLKPLEIPGKPVFEKGEPLRLEEKPTLELPKVENSKGEGQKVESKPEIEIKQEVPSEAPKMEEKPTLELLKVETAKGDSLKEEALKEIIIEFAKGTSLKEEAIKEIEIAISKGSSVKELEKLVLDLTKVSAKGESLKQEELKEILIKVAKGMSVSENKPELKLPTRKGLSLVQEELPAIELKNINYGEVSLIQEEQIKVELAKTNFSEREDLEKIQKLEEVLKESEGKKLPKTTSTDTENDLTLPLALSSTLILAGLIQTKRRKNN